MVQRYFINSWLLPCSLRSHRTANPKAQKLLSNFPAMPTHHPENHFVGKNDYFVDTGYHLVDKSVFFVV